MIPNPWLILGAAALWAASVWYAYDSGGTNRENKIGAQHATQLETVIKGHNEDTAIDMQAAAEWGERRGVARGRADANASKIDRDLAANPLPVTCTLSAGSVGLLNDSIRDANGIPPAPVGLPGSVPGVAGPGGRSGGNPPALGVKLNQPGR